MINIDHINEYVILAETLNYSKAAEKAFITQSALSRHIVSIEKSLGVELFDRTTRVVALTEAGEKTYEAFLDIQARLQELEEALDLLQSEKQECLRICCPNYWMGDYLEPILLSPQLSKSRCKFILEAHQPIDSLARVAQKTSDFFFGLGMPTHLAREIKMEHVTDEPACVLVTKDDPRSKCEYLTLAELEHDTLVLIEEGNGGYDAMNQAIIGLFESRGVHIKETKYANQVETLGTALLACRGVSVMPAAFRHMKRDYLACVPLNDEFRFPLCFYYRRDFHNLAIPLLLDAARDYTHAREQEYIQQ